jgi:hypothetical protein
MQRAFQSTHAERVGLTNQLTKGPTVPAARRVK